MLDVPANTAVDTAGLRRRTRGSGSQVSQLPADTSPTNVGQDAPSIAPTAAY